MVSYTLKEEYFNTHFNPFLKKGESMFVRRIRSRYWIYQFVYRR